MVFVLFNLFLLLKHITYTKECMDFWGPTKWPSMMSILSPHQNNFQSKILCESLSFCCCFISAQYPCSCAWLCPLYKWTIYMHSSLICSFYSILLFLKCIHLVGIAVIYSFLLLWNILLCDYIMICFSIFHRYSFGFVVGSGIWTMSPFTIGWEFLYRT